MPGYLQRISSEKTTRCLQVWLGAGTLPDMRRLDRPPQGLSRKRWLAGAKKTPLDGFVTVAITESGKNRATKCTKKNLTTTKSGYCDHMSYIGTGCSFLEPHM